jgi:hypothetical protein
MEATLQTVSSTVTVTAEGIAWIEQGIRDYRATATTRSHKSMKRTKSFTKLYTFREKTIFFRVPVRSGSLDVSSNRSAAMTAAGFVATGMSAQPRLALRYD